jgi:hypothetical protein
MAVQFLNPRHPIHRINPEVVERLERAQLNVFDRSFGNALEFCNRVLADLKLAISLPQSLADRPATDISELPFADLREFYLAHLAAGGVTGTTAELHALNLSQRTQLVRAFEDPNRAIARVTAKVTEVVASFPRTAADIERGRNAGDVLDPYILAATQTLLYGGNFQGAIGATVAHKALMIIEGLMGHLHEDVVGDMRGNIRAPEPRGFNQEILDPFENPFPGADVVQPPTSSGERLRVHQVKSKTGTVKGGDGKRLGDQLRQLATYYDAETFYDALIGNTLRGHRSIAGVRTASPETVVTVGEAAFRELTRSSIGPELLLRVYQNAFSEAAIVTGYGIDAMVADIHATFQERAQAAGETFLEVVLHDAVGGPPEAQDSRVYVRPVRGRRAPT